MEAFYILQNPEAIEKKKKRVLLCEHLEIYL